LIKNYSFIGVLVSIFLSVIPVVNSTVDSNVDEIITVALDDFAKDSYQHIGTKKLFYKPYKYALKGYYQLLKDRKLTNKDFITVVDMTKSANEERMFVISTKTWEVVHSSLVAHGMKTGEEFAQDFSNEENSHQSSIGFYVTGEVYNGRHDKSLKLDGHEYSNSKARERGVVIHAADYVSKEYVKDNGRLGRSYGCPALPHEKYEDVVDLIKGGSCYFIYYPDKSYIKKSKYINASADFKLNCEGQFAK
jgi:hypothetical protein